MAFRLEACRWTCGSWQRQQGAGWRWRRRCRGTASRTSATRTAGWRCRCRWRWRNASCRVEGRQEGRLAGGRLAGGRVAGGRLAGGRLSRTSAARRAGWRGAGWRAARKAVFTAELVPRRILRTGAELFCACWAPPWFASFVRLCPSLPFQA